MSDKYLKQMADEIVARVIEAIGPVEDDRQFLTLEQVMDRLQISRRGLYKLTREDKVIPVVVVGDGLKRIRPADLDAYLATRVEGE